MVKNFKLDISLSDYKIGYFLEGNWGDGGPKSIAKFIGRQISKIVQLLLKDD